MTNRVVFGGLPGGGLGLRVSRPGNEVLGTGLTGKQIAFDSRWPAAMRILKSGVGTGAFVSFGATMSPIPFVILVYYFALKGEYRIGSATASSTGFICPAGNAYFVGVL